MTTTNTSAITVVQAYASWIALGGRDHYKQAAAKAIPLLASRLSSAKLTIAKADVMTELKSALTKYIAEPFADRSNSAFDSYSRASALVNIDPKGLLGDLIQTTSVMNLDPELKAQISDLIQHSSDKIITDDLPAGQDHQSDSTASEPSDIACTLKVGFRGKIQILFSCPACDHSMNAEQNDIGDELPCPNCQVPLTVPGALELAEIHAQSVLEASEAEKSAPTRRSKSKKRKLTAEDWDSLSN